MIEDGERWKLCVEYENGLAEIKSGSFWIEDTDGIVSNMYIFDEEDAFYIYKLLKNGKIRFDGCKGGKSMSGVTMEMYLQLQNRVEKLEQKLMETRKKELEWAVAQFRYEEHTNEQIKALEIIEQELGLR